MPIYEYQCPEQESGCPRCQSPFEVIQSLSEPPLTKCPDCGVAVKKIISWCRAAVVDESPEYARVSSQIKDHEQAGRYSHAAELADSYSAKVKDPELKSRALDNYSKAGYSPDKLNAYSKGE